MIRAALSAELLGLLGHTGNQAAAALALNNLAGVVLDLIGDSDLTAILTFFNDQGAQTASAGIEAGGQARRASAKNNYIINLAHIQCKLLFFRMSGMG